ncbi:hypothetical protein ACWIGI_37560 [Nocardia sp. NPDC055321]
MPRHLIHLADDLAARLGPDWASERQQPNRDYPNGYVRIHHLDRSTALHVAIAPGHNGTESITVTGALGWGPILVETEHTVVVDADASPDVVAARVNAALTGGHAPFVLAALDAYVSAISRSLGEPWHVRSGPVTDRSPYGDAWLYNLDTRALLHVVPSRDARDTLSLTVTGMFGYGLRVPAAMPVDPALVRVLPLTQPPSHAAIDIVVGLTGSGTVYSTALAAALATC